MIWLLCGAVIVVAGCIALYHLFTGHGDDVTVSESWLDDFHRNE